MSVSAESLASDAASTAESACFHCGLPVPAGTHFAVVIDGQRQSMCCHGCEAVAEAIVAAGLTDFYRHRTAPSRRAEDLIPEQLRGLELYDRPDVQKSFVRAEDEHVRGPFRAGGVAGVNTGLEATTSEDGGLATRSRPRARSPTRT